MHGKQLSGKQLKKAKHAIYRKKNRHVQEKNSKRSQQRRAAKSLNISASKAIEDFPIAKGGRCGRPQLEKVVQALRNGNEAGIREVLSNFDTLPQPLLAYSV